MATIGVKTTVGRPVLKRSLSLFDAVSVNVGAIIGAGIFVVTGIVAGLAGSALIMSLALAAVVSLFSALTFAELSASYPAEGGAYGFASRLVSPFTGFIAGWMWVISNTFVGAAVALGCANYLKAFVPAWPVPWLAVALIAVLTLLNILGAKTSAVFNNTLVVIKLGVLALFIAWGLFYVKPANLMPFEPFTPGVIFGAYFIFFAFSGFARVTLIAEEVRDAARNVPRAILLSLAVSTAVYIAVGLVAVGLVGPARLGGSGAPLLEASTAVGSPLLYRLVSMGGAVATASVCLTTILGVSRLAFAMARQGDLPALFQRTDPRFGTPYPAIVIPALLMAVLVFVSDLTAIVAVSTLSSLAYYAIGNSSGLKLGRPARRYSRLVPLAGLITCASFAVVVLFNSPQAWAAGVVVFTAGALYYFLVRKRTQKKAV